MGVKSTERLKGTSVVADAPGQEYSTCRYGQYYWLNTATGEVRPFKCHSWRCEAHRESLAWSWAYRVAMAAPERMVTLTNIPKDIDRARSAFQHLVRDLREREGIPFEYVRFFEVGAQTGMYHYHLGQRGDSPPQRLLSARARANGLGEVVDIRRCYGAGPGWYMSKYISKGLDTHPEGWRKVSASRHFFPELQDVAAVEQEQRWVLVKGEHPPGHPPT